MTVFVNDVEIEIFRGARAIDAIRKYYVTVGKPFRLKNMVGRDAWGNRIANDSPMEEGRKIYYNQETCS